MRFTRVIGAGALLLLGASAATQRIDFAVDRIDGAAFLAQRISGYLDLGNETSLELRIGEIEIAGQRWREVRVRCSALIQDAETLRCDRGALEAPVAMPVAFRYARRSRDIDVTVFPAKGESWHLQSVGSGTASTFTLSVERGLLSRLAQWWPVALPAATSGTVDGRVVYTDDADSDVHADLVVSNYGFSDASGLHAGEKIDFALTAEARQGARDWTWRGKLEWKAGDVLWDPFFLGGKGHSLDVVGRHNDMEVRFESGRLVLAGIAQADLTAVVSRGDGNLVTGSVRSNNVDLSQLYERLLKPVLQGTVLGDMRVEGRADLALEAQRGAINSAQLDLRQVSMEDKSRRFAVFGLHGALPWRRDQATLANLRLDGGELLQLPFGAFALPLQLRGMALQVRDVQAPLLDGKLIAREFAAERAGPSWRWRFSGGLEPVSMQRFTNALGLPAMHGTLSAEVPAVRYQASTVTVDGALQFKVFDGVVSAQKLVLEDAFGRAPRLMADVTMRNLDLDLLTRTFSFGRITGRVDASVRNFEMVNWEPVKFDARISSSAGDYPKRISQAAVENISALGGAGAAAAIQRSFLRFFETFGYSSLGLGCRLESGVCEMSGIENVPQGYLMVRGGGVPAISVIGYNRRVGWNELISRLKRVTAGNAIVK